MAVFSSFENISISVAQLFSSVLDPFTSDGNITFISLK